MKSAELKSVSVRQIANQRLFFITTNYQEAQVYFGGKGIKDTYQKLLTHCT